MLERPQSDVRLSVEAIDGAWKVRQFRKKEDYGVMKMITLKLKIKDIEVELTHVEALKLYNELSLFFNWQPTSISPQYPIVAFDGDYTGLRKGEPSWTECNKHLTKTETGETWAT